MNSVDRILEAIERGLLDHPSQHAAAEWTGSPYEAFDHVSCGYCRTPMEQVQHPVRGDYCWFAVCEHGPVLNGPKPPTKAFVLCDAANDLLPNEQWCDPRSP